MSNENYWRLHQLARTKLTMCNWISLAQEEIDILKQMKLRGIHKWK